MCRQVCRQARQQAGEKAGVKERQGRQQVIYRRRSSPTPHGMVACIHSGEIYGRYVAGIYMHV